MSDTTPTATTARARISEAPRKSELTKAHGRRDLRRRDDFLFQRSRRAEDADAEEDRRGHRARDRQHSRHLVARLLAVVAGIDDGVLWKDVSASRGRAVVGTALGL